MNQTPVAFDSLPRDPRGHFVLHFFAAVYQLIRHVERLEHAGGEPLAATMERYPFLAAYFDEMRGRLPKEATWDEGRDWWETAIAAWESTATGALPLRSLVQRRGLGRRDLLTLTLVGLVEEDSRFGTLIASLQRPLATRRFSLELAAQVMRDDATGWLDDARGSCLKLLNSGLLEAVDVDRPRSEWQLRAPAAIWDAVRGDFATQPDAGCQLFERKTATDVSELVVPRELLEQVAEIPRLIQRGQLNAVVLRGSPGSMRLEVMSAIAAAIDRDLLVVDAQPPADWSQFGALCCLANAMPVVTVEAGPGESVSVPHLDAGQGVCLGVLLGEEGGLRGSAVQNSITLTLPTTEIASRRRIWKQVLDEDVSDDLPAIAERFRLPGGHIRRVASACRAHAALNGRRHVQVEDVRIACRAFNRQLLDTLAERIDAEAAIEHLIVSPTTRARMEDLLRRCRHRERLPEKLGPAFSHSVNCGVRALLTGSSGTGKTLAARILAAELGMDLYRVDLGAVVNKYIGETEKNLHQLLSTAQELDIVLLLDEGDSLLGRRTDIKSANDRYANLETNYLLQKLEHYDGIVVVTTNLGDAIDPAFQRRMDVVVDFVAPRPAEILQIWQLHLPADHRVETDRLLELACRCELTGGQIRNAALYAALMALDEQAEAVTARHVELAIVSEYTKAGASCPLQPTTPCTPTGNGNHVAALVDALID